MLAQEGSSQSRRRSREAEAAIAKRRKPRPLSSIAANREAVPPPQKLRKYSLNDEGVFLVERARERLHVEDSTRGSELLAEGCLLELFDRDSRATVHQQVTESRLHPQVIGFVGGRNFVRRIEENGFHPQVTRVEESRYQQIVENVQNPQDTFFGDSRSNPQVVENELESNTQSTRFGDSRLNTLVLENVPNPQDTRFGDRRLTPQIVQNELELNTQLTRFGDSRFNNQVQENESTPQLTSLDDSRLDKKLVEDRQKSKFGESRLKNKPQVVDNELKSNPQLTRFEESRLNTHLDNGLNTQVTRLGESRLNHVVEDELNPQVTRLGEGRLNQAVEDELNPQVERFGEGRLNHAVENELCQVNGVGEDSKNPPGSVVSPRVDDEEVEPATPRHRPRSWYAKTTTTEEEQAKARRRKTHPGHHADYEEALSSLLWQPYECQRELTVCSSPDDSDVAYWLGCRLPEFRIPREDLGSLSSRTSSSATIDAEVGVSDREEWLERLPQRALVSPSLSVATGCRVSQAPDAGKNGSDMRPPAAVSGSSPPPVSGCAVASSQTTTSTNNVSLVRCYAATTTVSSVPSIDCVVATSTSSSTTPPNPVRTFTSTEAQTDDVVVDTPAVVRPRERRRHTRRQQPPPPTTTNLLHPPLTDRLPDILNSHLPPPYTTLPPPHLGLPPPSVATHLPPPVPVPSIPVLASPGSPPPPPVAVSNLVSGLRFPFAIVPAGRRRSRQYASSDEPKSCCGVVVSQAASVRWLMLLVLLVGLCCAFVGTLLLVTRAAGRDHLTLALLIIGVGVVLVGVSAAAWRVTSQDGPSCRAMLGLGGSGDELGGTSEPNRRFVPRLPPSYGRPHHPYAAMMYPEFQYRAPPPSYQASMQEYRLRLLLLDRHTTPTTNSMSPPPTYRSQAGSLLRAPIVTNRRDLIHYQVAPSQQSDYSRPPSYRSRTSCSRGGTDAGSHSLSSHSRDPSQLSMTSDAGGVAPPATVNVITVMGGTHPASVTHHEETEPIIKLAPGDESLSPIAPKDDTKDTNLVTIVQTSSQSTGPVIVTISGNADDAQTSRDTEMEILAHL